MATALILSRWKDLGGRFEIEAVSLAPSGIAVTDVTPYEGKDGAESIADGDPVVCHVDGLSAAQLTALNARTQVIALTSKQDADSDFDNANLTRAQALAIANRIRDEFGVPLAKIREFLADGAITRKELERVVKLLCKARKEGGK